MNNEIYLNKIRTQFGTIYIESLAYPREEEERIKVYDSDTNYIDYFSVEMLQDCADTLKMTIEEEYAKRIISFKSALRFGELLQYITTEDYAIVKQETPEVTNRIGDYYFTIKE